MTAASAPTFEEIALADSVAAWTAAIEGTVAWWTGAVRRGATPHELLLDGIRWWSEIMDRRRPGWTSPNEIVFEAPVARLRDFSTRVRIRSSRRSCCLPRPGTTRASSTTRPSRARCARSSRRV